MPQDYQLDFKSFMTEADTYRNQSIDLQSKSMDWFLYHIGLSLERVKKDSSRLLPGQL